ncbi:MAG: insulinase family protein, partial [Frankiales bacterium]
MASRTRALPGSPSSTGLVRRSVLPGGLRVVSEQVPGVRSVAFGIWVAVGSRDERASLHGASHFLEHLLFKGTRRRGALEISSLLDAVGGEMNAFTAKEYTCYYARVLDEDLALAVDVMADLVTDSLVTPDDVEVERGVILEEIAMHDDDPGDVVHDTFAAALWGDSPLGRNVIGSVESIQGLTRAQIDRFYR